MTCFITHRARRIALPELATPTDGTLEYRPLGAT
jgi:hypothetical protein